MQNIQRISSAIALSVFASTAAGCATSASDGDLRARAAFDLQCDQSKLQVVALDDKTKGVSGCGQRASYVRTELPPTWTEPAKETWVKNSETSGEAAGR